MLGLLRKFECPFCPRTGEGVMAIDLDAVCAGINSPRGHWETDLASENPGGIVRFNPAGHPSRPCRHLISLLIDVEVIRRTARESEFERPLSYTGNYDHPWFAANDPDGIYSGHLWTEVNFGEQRAFHPVTPYQIRFLGDTKNVPRSNWRVQISGTLFVAMDPDLFLEQIRAGVLQSQEFNLRHRPR